MLSGLGRLIHRLGKLPNAAVASYTLLVFASPAHATYPLGFPSINNTIHKSARL